MPDEITRNYRDTAASGYLRAIAEPRIVRKIAIVADARASAALNHTSNVIVTEGVLERLLGSLRSPHDRPDVVLVDPPRTGCLPRALSEIQRLEPRTFVYVSCDPATLARDLRIMCDNGYRLESVQPVDMFPFTTHIECVAFCERIGRAMI